MAEYRVKITEEENDSYVELWMLENRKGYVGRLTYGAGCWYHVCNPLGYFELDYPFKDDDLFIVCGPDWTELFRSSNGDGTAGFNTLREESKEQWLKYEEEAKTGVAVENNSANFFRHWATGEPAGGLNEWLMSFQDPNLYPEANDYPENWTMFRNEKIGETVLKKFSFLGRPFEIVAIHHRHQICGVEWDEIWSANEYIGSIFDSKLVGTMYTKRQAMKLAVDAVKSNFPDKNVISAAVYMKLWGEDEGYWVERRLKISDAAEKLLACDYHRDHVNRVCEAEREHTGYYPNYEAILADHPDCVKDNRYIY